MSEWVFLGTVSCDLGRGVGEPAGSTCAASPPGDEELGAGALLLCADEARALLRVSRNTLYRLAASGEIPGARKIGRAWRFRRDLLLEWLACSAPRVRTRRRIR